MFRKIVATVLFVQDYQKCLEFYRDTLGLEVKKPYLPNFAAFQFDDEQDFAVTDLATGAAQIGIEVSAFEKQSGGVDRVMLCAMVENCDEAYETLKAKGVTFTKAPVDQPWGIRAAYFLDPEGNVWEIAHNLPKQ